MAEETAQAVTLRQIEGVASRLNASGWSARARKRKTPFAGYEIVVDLDRLGGKAVVVFERSLLKDFDLAISFGERTTFKADNTMEYARAQLEGALKRAVQEP